MNAYDYPAAGVFWSVVLFSLFVIWLILVLRVFGDIFRSHDLGGLVKALWALLIIVLPFVGVLIYLIVRGGGISERDVERTKAENAEYQTYIRDMAAPSYDDAAADRLADLAAQRDAGTITEAEFNQHKANLLG